MVALLQEVQRVANPQRNTFLNEQRWAMIAAVPLPEDPSDRVTYLSILGQEQLLSGRSSEAVESFEALLSLLAVDPQLPFSADGRRNMMTWRALAYLRLGEQENCIAQHNSDRCLLPIREGGVHAIERGSRGAIAAYSELLEESPDDLSFRWLLNLATMTLGEYPDAVPPQWRIPPESLVSDFDIGRFEDVAGAVGLDVFGLSGGSIVDDFTGDGYLDVVASAWGLDEQIRFFVNDRQGGFFDATEKAGLAGIVGGLNIFQADYDNDGRLDVLVLRGAWLQNDGRHPNSLLRNLGPDAQGNVRFADVTEEAGLMSFHPTKVAAWGDYDNDGWVDLFIGNESTLGATHPAELFRSNGLDSEGRVTFENVALDAGVALIAYIKGAVWGDYDNDGRIDLYVSNLSGAGPNFLYRNLGPQPDGVWRFSDVTARVGAEGPKNSFPTWFWDYDNDGWLDLFASSYSADIADVASEYLGRGLGTAQPPTLYRNTGAEGGEPRFEDRTLESGLDTILLSMGANFGDLDNDGFLDFYVGTGDTEMRTLMPNRMFRNDGGRRFQDVTSSGGFGHLQKGHGISFSDIDNDGDQDVHAVMGGAHSGDGFRNVLFENPGHGNRWITLQLVGAEANRAAIGARLRVRASGEEGERSVYRTVGSGGSFGASTLRQEIGLGRAERIIDVEIRWPGSDVEQHLGALELDRFYRVRQGDEEAVALELQAVELGGSGRKSH